jgi:surface carbohydrate biosynthesis protein
MKNDKKNFKRTCILTIEVGEREWDPTIFLANALCRRGYRVLVGTNRAVKILENQISSSIFLHKSTIEKYAVRYKSTLGAKVCFLDIESGITLPDHRYEQYCSERFKAVSKEKYHTIFTIGEKYKSVMQNMLNFNEVNVVASGWPRLELLSKKNRSFYDRRVNELKAKYGDFVLAVSSFGFVTTEEYREWVKVDKDFFGDDYESPARPYLQKFINLLEDCDKKLKQKVIFRPHPAEFITSWQSCIGNLTNVQILLDGDIVPWLIAADSIIQFRSSTALEAALLDKESLALRIDSDSFETNSPIYDLNHEFDNSDALIEYINSKKFSETLNKTVLSKLDQHISNIFDEPSKIIADELDKIEIKEIMFPKISYIRKLKHHIFMIACDIVEKLFFNTIISPPRWRYLFTYKAKLSEPVTQYNCQKRITALADGLTNLSIKQISRDLVCMETMNEVE